MSDGAGLEAVGVWTDGTAEVRRSYTLPMRRALYWRLSTGAESHTEAAEVAGVTDRQVRRWLQRPDFRADWDNAEGWARTEVRRQRTGLEYKALLRAHLLLDAPETPASVTVDLIGKALTDARQTRALDTQPARAGLSAYLEELGRESAEILKEARRELGG